MVVTRRRGMLESLRLAGCFASWGLAFIVTRVQSTGPRINGNSLLRCYVWSLLLVIQFQPRKLLLFWTAPRLCSSFYNSQKLDFCFRTTPSLMYRNVPWYTCPDSLHKARFLSQVLTGVARIVLLLELVMIDMKDIDQVFQKDRPPADAKDPFIWLAKNIWLDGRVK